MKGSHAVSLAAALMLMSGVVLAGPPAETVIKELGTIDPAALPKTLTAGTVTSTFTVCPDGTRVAVIVPVDKQYALWCDGKNGELYDGIAMVSFSPDGSGLAYKTRQVGKYFVVHNDKPSPACDDIGVILFSPCSKHLAYTASGQGKWFMAMDGKPEKSAWTEIRDPVFSPDGRRLAYMVKSGNMDGVVLNGKVTTCQHDWPPRWIGFSAEGGHFAYQTKSIWYWMTSGASYGYIVMDGRRGGNLDRPTSPVWSRKGAGLAYGARTRVQQGTALEYPCAIYLNGKMVAQETAEDIDSITLSDDGKRVAYVLRISYGGIAPPYVVVHEKQRSALLHSVAKLTFSPDGTRLAYAGGFDDQGKQAVVVDGRPGPDVTSFDQNIVFSPDSKRLAYWATPQGTTGKGGHSLIVDGEVTTHKTPTSGPWDPIFSPDSKHLACVARDAETGKKCAMVVDGQQLPSHDFIWIPSAFAVAPPTIRYVALDGSKLTLFEVTWPPSTQ